MTGGGIDPEAGPDRRGFGWLMVFALGLVALDQTVKIWVEAGMELGEHIQLLPFFYLYRTRNEGVAFSMLAHFGPSALIVISLVISAFVLILLWRTPASRPMTRFGLALIIGGAVGNLIDRASLGYVVDYFLFQTRSFSFAVFNLADAFISVGAVMIVVDELRQWLRDRQASP